MVSLVVKLCPWKRCFPSAQPRFFTPNAEKGKRGAIKTSVWNVFRPLAGLVGSAWTMSYHSMVAWCYSDSDDGSISFGPQ